MSSKEPSDLLDLESAIPTTADDVRALRKNRPQAGDDWLDQIQRLADQFPASYEDLANRPTFDGFEPFEL